MLHAPPLPPPAPRHAAPRNTALAHHAPKQLTDTDKAVLGDQVWPLWTTLLIAALVGLIVAVVAAPFSGGGWDRLGFAYLTAYAFALSITLGCLFFVIVTTVFRAGWCVAFRRVPETVAASMPTFFVLAIPLLVLALVGNGSLYPWTAEGIHETGHAMISHSDVAPSTHDAGHGAEDEAGHDDHGNPDPGNSHRDPHDDHAATTAPAGGLLADDAMVFPVAETHAAGDAPSAGSDTHLPGHGNTHDAPGTDKNDQYVATDPNHDGPEHADHQAHDSAHGDSHAAGHGDGHGGGHSWTHTAEAWPDHNHAVPYFVARKGPWLTAPFWVVRWLAYVGIWSLIGWFFWKRSVRQDADADVQHTHRREWWAPLSIAAFALTVTLASYDLILSLDPVWYSTMYGVYFFAGCFTAGLSTIIITLMLGQRAGYFPSITTDHFHDLGKLLFAFVFFWGYVGFSQFMLIWYASLPETTYWWEIRGVTSVSGTVLDAAPPTFGGPWTVVAWTLLFAHLLLPFAILLSKHVKRNRTALMVMAWWMLTLCYVDLYWVIMPALSSPNLYFPLVEIGCVVFCVGVMLAEALRRAKDHSLTAYNDPRMHESIGLDTSAWAPIHH